MPSSDPSCSHCGGRLSRALPPDLLDPRLDAAGHLLRCEGCGRVERAR